VHSPGLLVAMILSICERIMFVDWWLSEWQCTTCALAQVRLRLLFRLERRREGAVIIWVVYLIMFKCDISLKWDLNQPCCHQKPKTHPEKPDNYGGTR
jgi:hypothetical protein